MRCRGVWCSSTKECSSGCAPLTLTARRPAIVDPFRVGLDHISFSVPARPDLDAAVKLFDERGVPHGPIRELASFGLAFLAFFDPDGIALELTAPIARSGGSV